MLKQSLGAVDLTRPELSIKGVALMCVAAAVLYFAFEAGKHLLGLGKGVVGKVAPAIGAEELLGDYPM